MYGCNMRARRQMRTHSPLCSLGLTVQQLSASDSSDEWRRGRVRWVAQIVKEAGGVGATVGAGVPGGRQQAGAKKANLLELCVHASNVLLAVHTQRGALGGIDVRTLGTHNNNMRKHLSVTCAHVQIQHS